MKIKSKYQVEKMPLHSISTVLNHLHRYDKDTLELTNGHIFARIPAQKVGKEFYPLKEFKKAKKEQVGSRKIGEVEFDSEIKCTKKYPITDTIIPKNMPSHHKVIINAKLLFELSQILGAENTHVLLQFSKSKYDSIRVTPYQATDNNAFGLIMPIREEL